MSMFMKICKPGEQVGVEVYPWDATEQKWGTLTVTLDMGSVLLIDRYTGMVEDVGDMNVAETAVYEGMLALAVDPRMQPRLQAMVEEFEDCWGVSRSQHAQHWAQLSEALIAMNHTNPSR